MWMRNVDVDEVPSIVFSLDVSDLNAAYIPESSRLAGGYLFTVRHAPVIPEPASGALLFTAVASAVGFRGRRRTS
jgi:hypothetical protein